MQLPCLKFTVWNKTGDFIQRSDVKGGVAFMGDFSSAEVHAAILSSLL